MATFTYTAKDELGKTVKGSVQADARSNALALVRAQGLTPLNLSELSGREARKAKKADKPATGPRRRLFGGGRVSLAQKALFCRQMAISVSSGVSLRESIESIAADEDHPAFRAVLGDVIQDLHSGKTFSQAVERHPRVFPPLFVSLVRAAEESGSMPETLKQLSSALERSERLASRLRSITAYPVFVGGFFIIVCAVMTLFVLPKFADIFKDMDSELPPLTQFVFGLNDFVIHNFFFIVVGLVVAVVAFVLYARTPVGRLSLDRLQLRLPLFGSWIMRFAVARFCRNLAIMIQGGVPVATAMEMSAATTGNQILERGLMAARERIMTGSGIAASLAQDPLFPRLVCRMVSVGESSGQLPQVLENVSELYEDQVEGSITMATSMFEPLVICLFGGVILVLVMAIYIPIFTMAGKG